MNRTSPLTITGGHSDTVRVSYTTGAAGTSDNVSLIADSIGTQPTSNGSATLAVTVPPALAPSVSLTPHNGDNHATGLCAAACFDVTFAYSTPAYVSRDTPHSAALVYSSAQARPMPIVQVDVTDASVWKANRISLKLQQNQALVTFLNGASGSTELYWQETSPGATMRLAGQFDGTSLTTGVYHDSVIVTSRWDSTNYAGSLSSTTALLNVLVVNEQASPFGAGWSLAGLEKLYKVDTMTLAVTDGTGSIVRFTKTCDTCQATAAAADFSVINSIQDANYHRIRFERRWRDGTISAFDTLGYLQYRTDRFAVDTTKFVYDASHHIQTITDPAGKALTFAYSSAGKLITITDPGGRVTHFQVNGSGDLAYTTDATGTIDFQAHYDSYHRMTQRTDRAGNTQWQYYYDFASEIASDSIPQVKLDPTVTGTGTLVTKRPGTKTRSFAATVLIDPGSGLGTSTNPAPQLQPGLIREAAFSVTGDSVRYVLDRFLGALAIETPLAADTVFTTRDANGRVTNTSHHRKNNVLESSAVTYNGPRVSSVSNALTGTWTAFSYDTLHFDLVTAITGTMPTVHNYLNAAYKAVDSTRVFADPDTTKDTVTVFTRDSRGRAITVIDPAKTTTSYYFGTSGFQNLDSVRTGTQLAKSRFDSYGRTVRRVNPRGDSSITIFDLLNRADTILAPGGGRTAMAYDSLSRVRQFTDAKGQVYTTHFNALGWVDTTMDAVTSNPDTSRRDIFEYTITGAVRAHVNRNRKRTATTFDHLGRDSTLTLADGRVTSFAYDTGGTWYAVSNGESIDTIRTSSGGTNVWEISHRGTHRYVDSTYGNDSLHGSLPLFKGLYRDGVTIQTTNFHYDFAQRLDTLNVGGKKTIFAYNADWTPTSIRHTYTNSNGTLTTIDQSTITVTALQTRFSVLHSNVLDSNFAELLTRDSLNRITQRITTRSDTAWNFAYDARGQLTNYKIINYNPAQVCTPENQIPVMDGETCTSGTPHTLQNTTLSYDSVGNRADGSPTLIAGNRLTSWQGFTLTYDATGNLTHKTNGTFDQLLFWNSIGQLDSVKTNGSLVTFGYDGFGRRVRKTVGSVVYQIIYDGDQISTIDSTGTLIRTFAYYPGVDQPHSVLMASGKRYYFVQESGAGSVWGLIDSTGAVQDRYRYSLFGLLTDSSVSIPNALRFTGREYDAETQLYYYRARYYDPTLARFVSEDPAGLSAGVNQYAYAAGDPVNARDPSGMDWESATTDFPPNLTCAGGEHQDEIFGNFCVGATSFTHTSWTEGFGWLNWEAAVAQNMATAQQMLWARQLAAAQAAAASEDDGLILSMTPSMTGAWLQAISTGVAPSGAPLTGVAVLEVTESSGILKGCPDLKPVENFRGTFSVSGVPVSASFTGFFRGDPGYTRPTGWLQGSFLDTRGYFAALNFSGEDYIDKFHINMVSLNFAGSTTSAIMCSGGGGTFLGVVTLGTAD
jgi:RHS repeat-associated protein